MQRVATVGAAVLACLATAGQGWNETSLGTFLSADSQRTWRLEARKGGAEFSELKLGAKLSFKSTGKVAIVQAGSPNREWSWSVVADPRAPLGCKLRLNGTSFQIIPVRRNDLATDRLTIVSQDEKLDVPAKIYIVSPKPK